MQGFVFEPALVAVTYADFERALERLPYGSACRVALQLFAATGCRISELEHMDPANLLDGYLYWRPGKNQKGLRRERLPPGLCEELVAYRRAERTRSGFLLGVAPQTLVRYFDRDARPQIGGAWAEREAQFMNGRGWSDGWRLHLKGFRKTFQTVLFAHFYERYGDAQVALEWVSKRMKHSSEHLTAYHYLQDFRAVGVERWLSWLNTGRAPVQERLLEYL